MQQKSTPAQARLKALVERALFDLRLAADVARTEGYGPDVVNLVEHSRRTLHTCLATVARRRKEAA